MTQTYEETRRAELELIKTKTLRAIRKALKNLTLTHDNKRYNVTTTYNTDRSDQIMVNVKTARGVNLTYLEVEIERKWVMDPVHIVVHPDFTTKSYGGVRHKTFRGKQSPNINKVVACVLEYLPIAVKAHIDSNTVCKRVDRHEKEIKKVLKDANIKSYGGYGRAMHYIKINSYCGTTVAHELTVDVSLDRLVEYHNAVTKLAKQYTKGDN